VQNGIVVEATGIYSGYTVGQPYTGGGLGGSLGGLPKGYNPRGWTGPRPSFTPTKDTRDNSIPIWDTGPVLYSTDYATYHPPPSLGGSGGGGGGGGGVWPFPNWGDISKWIDDLSKNIMDAVQQALTKVGITINLNGTKILESQNNAILRRLNSIV
jgi:hypothetical protein